MANLAVGGAAPTPENLAELMAGKEYYSHDRLKGLEDGAWKSSTTEKMVAGVNWWRGDGEARGAV